jgi:hypothetical protein
MWWRCPSTWLPEPTRAPPTFASRGWRSCRRFWNCERRCWSPIAELKKTMEKDIRAGEIYHGLRKID